MTKREKKKNKNRLLLLILLLVVSAVVLGTSTYAWFISNKTVSVDSLDVQARTSTGLQISASAFDYEWSNTLSKDDLIEHSWSGNINQLPTTLDHVSTAGLVGTDGLLNMYTGTVTPVCDGEEKDGSCNPKTNTDGTTTTGNYNYMLSTTKAGETMCNSSDEDSKCGDGATFMAFDIFLKYTGESDKAVTLYLGANSGVTKTETRSYGIENAVRVAFVVEGYVDMSTYTNAVDNNTLNTVVQSLSNATADDVYIWEPNYDTHTQSGKDNASQYGISTEKTGAAKIAYEGVKAVFSGVNLFTENNSTANSGANADKFQSVTPKIYTASKVSRTSTQIQLKPGVTKIRVYFWVEGQDVDTENDATGHNMKLNLEFNVD